MSNFSYIIKNKSGLIQKGRIEAGSAMDAAISIKKPGYFIIELKGESKSNWLSKFKKNDRLSMFEKINFTDHLASLIRSGTPIRDALEAYADDGNKRLTMIDSIIKTIEQGKKLSAAFAKYPSIFSPTYI